MPSCRLSFSLLTVPEQQSWRLEVGFCSSCEGGLHSDSSNVMRVLSWVDYRPTEENDARP